MLPLKDDIPSRSTPVVTIGLIAVNVLVFLYQASLQWSGDVQTARAAEAFVLEFGAIPCRLTGLCAVPDSFPHPFVTILTSMFLHGGLLHVGGNMLYLWIFGDNVEDSLGHGRFLVFYVISGVAAAAAQVAAAPTSGLPMIGASGAVSGVLGAYLLLFPHASVLTLVTFVFFFRFIRIPAVIVLGLWIVVQLFNGLGSFRMSFPTSGGEAGVAWFAHIGGFLAGLALLLIMRRWDRARL
jgi:membrane associated rhomboid family serine protease